ncbi:MAG: peptidase [Thermoanaerobaculia bacterium]|nr:peptidase [Thermoanaerobaculia bacterium]
MRRLATPFFALLAALLLLPAAAPGAVITIVNNDGPNEGFNDPTPAAPVGGNPGVTLGQQRLNVFQRAAEIWGASLVSPVEILVRAQMDPQTCSGTSAVLGSAGTTTIHRDFTNAPVAGTWYHQALANSLAGVDLSAAQPDINTTFNSQIDTGCLTGTVGWYYGLEPEAPADRIALLPVVLHELSHGLGFANFVNEATGQWNSGFPDIYSVFTYDNTAGLFWTQMNDAQRIASAINTYNVVWTGPVVFADAPRFLGPKPELQVTSPPAIAGPKLVQTATFGPPISVLGVTGSVVLAQDPGGISTTDACEPIVNNVTGAIALVDRGNCTFVVKAQNVQAAGAIGLVVANHEPNGLPGMGGTDPAITIPAVGIQLADGNAIKAQLPAPGVTATLAVNQAGMAGADALGNVLLNAPNPVQLGSSISHWDPLTSPNTLMEPAINDDLFQKRDLTPAQLEDIGWTVIPFGDGFSDGFERGSTSVWSAATP